MCWKTLSLFSQQPNQFSLQVLGAVNNPGNSAFGMHFGACHPFLHGEALPCCARAPLPEFHHSSVSSPWSWGTKQGIHYLFLSRRSLLWKRKSLQLYVAVWKSSQRRRKKMLEEPWGPEAARRGQRGRSPFVSPPAPRRAARWSRHPFMTGTSGREERGRPRARTRGPLTPPGAGSAPPAASPGLGSGWGTDNLLLLHLLPPPPPATSR